MCKLMNKHLGFIFFALQHVYFDLRYVAVHLLAETWWGGMLHNGMMLLVRIIPSWKFMAKER